MIQDASMDVALTTLRTEADDKRDRKSYLQMQSRSTLFSFGHLEDC